jgi:pyruvate dehydrogenase E2 component (dihydrolipoamide acetyltransferase)
MAIEIRMPALSPTMEEGTIARWLVKAGDEVHSGDVLAEIETDKAVMEFEAVDEGKIASIDVPVGQEGVKVGTVIATIAGEDEATPAKVKAEPAKAKAEPAKEPAKIEKSEAAPSAQAAPKAADKTPAEKPAPSAALAQMGDRVIASPLARRIAAQKGIDLHSVKGSGPNGRIVRADVEGAPASVPAAHPSAAAATPDKAQPAPAAPGEIPHEVIKLTAMRKTIARRLTESKQTIPHYYLTIDCRLDALLDARAQMNEALKPRGIKLSVNDFLIKALGAALVAVPDANVRYTEEAMLKFSRVDISMAVAIPGGLITPVIVDVAGKSLSTIARETQDLAGRAREGKLRPEEYQGGTASISNLGMYGIRQFEAVINPPQAMILAVGAGEKRPWVLDDHVKMATILTATGSFDHRAVDGATGAELMEAFRRSVEAPIGMLA